jgi:hypothetical protein
VISSFGQIDSTEAKKNSKTESPKKKGNAVSFKNDVNPLIKKYCMPCHAEEQMNPSELYMDSYETLIEGGKHGKPIEPGKAKQSLLIQKLSEKPPFGDRMPLKAKEPLPDEVVKILTEWINQGAKKN